MLWPVYSPSFLCMTRATVSVPPPGANPTTTVTGRVGYVWAVAFAAMASAAASAMMSFMLLLLFSLTAPFTGRLLSLEHGLALLHEGSASFDVVLALEAGFDQRGARLGVEGRAPLEQLAHDALRCPDRERRVLRDHRAVLENERFELGDRCHPVHEAHRLRFLGLELAAGGGSFWCCGSAAPKGRALAPPPCTTIPRPWNPRGRGSATFGSPSQRRRRWGCAPPEFFKGARRIEPCFSALRRSVSSPAAK